MKKSFKSQNPALQYINTEQRDNTPEKPGTADEYVYTHIHAEQPISCHSKELKSRRLQLLIKPSTYSAIADSAKINGVSVNDAINRILENHLQRNRQSDLNE